MLQFLLVCVDLGGEFSEECGNSHAYLVHFVVKVFHVLNCIQDKRLGFLLSTLDCGTSTVIYDRVEGLSFFQLSIILDQEILEVIESNVSILIGILHVLIQPQDYVIEHALRLVVHLTQFFLNRGNKVFCELRRWSLIQLLQ